MASDLDSPQFWRALYRAPVDSSTRGAVSSAITMEAGDLDAWLDPYARSAPDALHGLDTEALTALVESLVVARLAQLGVGRPVPAAPAPSSPPPAPRAAPPAPPAPPAPRATPSQPPPQAPPAVGNAMWERVPVLSGGQAALLRASDLSQDSIGVLVMVDGNTSLRGLRMLVPQVDDQGFLTIVRDAIRRGLIELT